MEGDKGAKNTKCLREEDDCESRIQERKGYPIPQLPKALRAIEREEKKLFDRSPIVYICSPYKGDVKPM